MPGDLGDEGDLVGGDRGDDRARDREEGRRRRYGEHRQPELVPSLRERLRDIGVDHSGVEREAGGTDVGEALGIRTLSDGVVREVDSEGHEQFAALEPGGRVEEFARVRPRDVAPAPGPPADEPQPEAAVADELFDGDPHRPPLPHSGHQTVDL